MNILLVASVLLAVPAVMGQLMCNTCPVNLEEDCLGNSATTVTCGTNETCFIGSANFTRFVLRTKGCVNTTFCDTSITALVMGTNITVSNMCCNTSRCNGATSLQMVLPVVIGAALMATWSSYK